MKGVIKEGRVFRDRLGMGEIKSGGRERRGEG